MSMIYKALYKCTLHALVFLLEAMSHCRINERVKTCTCLVGNDEVEEVLGRNEVLSPQRRDKVSTDIDDRLVHVDVVLDDLMAELGRHERVVGRDELGRNGRQSLVRPREQPVDARVVHHAREVATPPATDERPFHSQLTYSRHVTRLVYMHVCMHVCRDIYVRAAAYSLNCQGGAMTYRMLYKTFQCLVERRTESVTSMNHGLSAAVSSI